MRSRVPKRGQGQRDVGKAVMMRRGGEAMGKERCVRVEKRSGKWRSESIWTKEKEEEEGLGCAVGSIGAVLVEGRIDSRDDGQGLGCSSKAGSDSEQ